MADVHVENLGTIFTFTPLTEAGREWIREYIEDGYEWSNGSMCVDHRYAQAIAQRMLDDGLEVE